MVLGRNHSLYEIMETINLVCVAARHAARYDFDWGGSEKNIKKLYDQFHNFKADRWDVVHLNEPIIWSDRMTEEQRVKWYIQRYRDAYDEKGIIKKYIEK